VGGELRTRPLFPATLGALLVTAPPELSQAARVPGQWRSKRRNRQRRNTNSPQRLLGPFGIGHWQLWNRWQRWSQPATGRQQWKERIWFSTAAERFVAAARVRSTTPDDSAASAYFFCSEEFAGCRRVSGLRLDRDRLAPEAFGRFRALGVIGRPLALVLAETSHPSRDSPPIATQKILGIPGNRFFNE